MKQKISFVIALCATVMPSLALAATMEGPTGQPQRLQSVLDPAFDRPPSLYETIPELTEPGVLPDDIELKAQPEADQLPGGKVTPLFDIAPPSQSRFGVVPR